MVVAMWTAIIAALLGFVFFIMGAAMDCGKLAFVSGAITVIAGITLIILAFC